MNWDAVLAAVVVAVPSLVIGVLAYRRSRQVDAIAAQSGLAQGARNGTAQVLQGLNDLIENLQEDNKNFRDDIKNLVTRCDEVSKERDTLRLEMARLRKRYGENGDTPQPPNKENPPGLT